MGERIHIRAADDHPLQAYQAFPEGPPKGAVVLIGEIFGLNRWVRSEVDRYAAAGYMCISPALLDRVEPGYETDEYGPDAYEKIGAFMKDFGPEKALVDVEAAIELALEAGKVGITGYCFGGMVSWRAAHAGLGLSAASGYYGGGVPNYIDLAPAIPIEMHYGDQDSSIPNEQVEQLRHRYPDVPIHMYRAGHAFCNSDRPNMFNAEAAKLANQRTLDFFAKHLAS